MAKRHQFKTSVAVRRRRSFSENFKKEKVREIELGRTRVLEISKQYEVAPKNVYAWLTKFGTMSKKPERTIVESQSDTKELLALKKKIAELERLVGQKQIQLDFKDKMIEIAEQMYGVDIKKKLSTKLSDSTGSTENDTPSV